MVLPPSHRVSRVPWYSGYCLLSHVFAYEAFTLSGRLSQNLSITIVPYRLQSEPQNARTLVWALSLSLAATQEIDVSFSSSGYLDVSVPRVPHVTLWIHVTLHDSSPWGFPHSEICGSKLICSSPQLIAACHVLHRLLMPRHSPYALVRLNFLYNVSHYTMVLFELSEFLAELSLSRTFRSGLLTLLRMKRLFFRLLHLL